jgi:hypothetical protein
MNKSQLDVSAKQNASYFLDSVYEPALNKAQKVMDKKNQERDEIISHHSEPK